MMKDSSRFLKIILLFFLSLLFVVFISFVFAFWHAYPRGVDATVHALKIFWVAKFFPHHNWWNIWAAGMPHFQFYPIGPNIIMAFVSNAFNFSPEAVLALAAVFSMGLMGFFVGLLVYEYSKNFLTAILASFILISTPGMWDSAIIFGSYIRMLAMPFLVASLYFASKLAYKPESKKYLFATIVSLALSLSIHMFIGLQAVGLTVLLLLFLISGFKEKLLVVAKTLLPFALISSYYLIPLLVFSPRSTFNMIDVAFTLDRYRYYRLEEILGIWQGSVLLPRTFLTSSPFVFPLFIFLLIVVFLVNRKIFKKLLVFFVLGASTFLFFSSNKFYFLERLYAFIYTFAGGVHSLFHLAVISSILSIGLLIGKSLGKFANFVSLGLIILLFSWLWISFSPNPQAWKESIFPKVENYVGEEDLFLEVPENAQFRFGTGTEAYLAMVFNRYYPDYPQTRDYFAKGVINNDSNFYLTKAVWGWEDNLEETKFLLDWWAVDKFLVRDNSENLEKFDSFNLIGEWGLTGLLILEFGQPPPILSSTNTPVVLFIGDWENYMILFHALAQANINSQKLIPIYLGKDSLAGLKLDELKKFPVVFVYDAELDDEKSQKVLEDYVKEGGSLFIEGPRQEISDLPEFFPMRGVKKNEVRGVWDLVQQNYDFGTNFEAFSPPVYEEGPWGVSTAESLSSWAKVLVSESGKPIMVGGNLGKGKVVWSGMNLPYHINNYRNKEESLLLKSIFDWLGDGEEIITRTDFEVNFIHPEKRVISLKSKANGVLFKEVHFPKWRSYFEKDGKRNKLPIYTAGPDFMYIPLSGVETGGNLILEYKKTSVDWLAAFVSLATLSILILWLFDWWVFKPWVTASIRKINSSVKGISEWWESEDK